MQLKRVIIITGVDIIRIFLTARCGSHSYQFLNLDIILLFDLIFSMRISKTFLIREKLKVENCKYGNKSDGKGRSGRRL